MLELNQSIGYSKQVNVLGAIVEFSLLNGTITLMDNKSNTYTVSIEDVTVLDEIGAMGNMLVYRHDVFEATNGVLYEVDTDENDEVVLHFLDKNLNRVKAGMPFPKESLSQFDPYLELVGNKLQMEAQKPTISFNVAVFRNINENDGEVTYYYVGNNAEEETVDLIKVVFFGHQIFEEHDYERITLSHEDFLVQVANGEFKQVQPMELSNYITGLYYGKEAKVEQVIVTAPIDIEEETCEECCGYECVCPDLPFDIDDEDIDLEIDLDLDFELDDEEDELFETHDQPKEDRIEGLCQGCGEPEDDCECSLWTR